LIFLHVDHSRTFAARAAHIVSRILLALLAAYKRWLSPLLGARCRFHPSCSDYARDAVERFGAARGGVLALWRILRCQPLCRGGFDPVPSTFTLRRCIAHHRPDSEDPRA
jgi:putative membrane protein insertion efficiency factor